MTVLIDEGGKRSTFNSKLSSLDIRVANLIFTTLKKQSWLKKDLILLQKQEKNS